MARKVRNPGVGSGHGQRVRKDIHCKDCGAVFHAVRALFCSSCRERRQRESNERSEATRSTPCPDCGQPTSRRALYCRACSPKHSAEQRRRRGEQNHMWKGGQAKDGDYILIRINGKYIPEHRYVWQQAHGSIDRTVLIHHLNGIKTDNRLENLYAVSRVGHRHRERMVEPLEARIRDLEAQLQ